MADGYARATGRVGVCLATSGPGATNLVTGIANAIMDSVPMVAITGNVNSWAIGKDAFQETDIQGITIPITKHNYLVTNVADLPYALEEAFYLAGTGRKGPVLVDIPKDVFIAKTDAPFPDKIVRRGYSLPPAPRNDQIEEAARLVRESERPVMIAGAGVLWSEAFEELRTFAETAQHTPPTHAGVSSPCPSSSPRAPTRRPPTQAAKAAISIINHRNKRRNDATTRTSSRQRSTTQRSSSVLSSSSAA
jgi:acetolactate synthase-1/2/3 large subunit